MEGDDEALSGRIISGLVRVGLGRPLETWEVERTDIFNDYMERIDLVGEF